MRLASLVPVLPLLVACGVEGEATPASLADEAAGPPGAGGLTLTADGILQPGTQLNLTVTGAAPNSTVFLVRGTGRQAGALCPPPLGGLCVDVANPQILAQIRANGQGRAVLNANVPNLPDGTRAYFQAATTTQAATSNVVAKYNPLSTAGQPTGLGSTTLFRVEEATVTTQNGYNGLRTDIWDSAVAGMESCVYEGPVTGTNRGNLPVCNGCEFAYQVTVGPFTEVPSTGDCLDILNIDLAASPAFTAGIGFEQTYNLPPYGNVPVAMGFDTSLNVWRAIAPATFDPATNAFAWEAPGATTYTY